MHVHVSMAYGNKLYESEVQARELCVDLINGVRAYKQDAYI